MFHTLRKPSLRPYPPEPAIHGRIRLSTPQRLDRHMARQRLQCQITTLFPCQTTYSGTPLRSLTSGTQPLPYHNLPWLPQAIIRSPRQRAYPCCPQLPRIYRHHKHLNPTRQYIHRVLRSPFCTSKRTIAMAIRHNHSNNITLRRLSNHLLMRRIRRSSLLRKIGSRA